MQDWKLSIGTAGAIGLRHLKTDAPPTTAYIMLGERCLRNCAFCAQARASTAGAKFLSRVAWHGEEEDRAIQAIGAAYREGKIKRVCLQVVETPDSFAIVARALAKFKAYPGLPVVVSCHVANVAQAEHLFALGAARLGIALDVATPALFAKIKGGSFEKRWQLLSACAAKFPGKITTHLIVGLGETEKEMWEQMCACVARKITVALFAFTPLQGTPLAATPPPDRSSYRRLQISLELLRRGYPATVVHCDATRITAIDLPHLAELLADGHAFYTCGCPDCNRPYYNDHPGRPLYNYHRPLTPAELTAALGESDLAQLSCEAGAAAVSSAPGSGTTVLSVSAVASITATKEKEAPHA